MCFFFLLWGPPLCRGYRGNATVSFLVEATAHSIESIHYLWGTSQSRADYKADTKHT